MADRTVYVGNVDAEVDEATLRAVFENCGYVTQVRIAGRKGYNTVYCFVEFAELSQAALALAMDGLQLGDRQIKVSMAKITAPRPTMASQAVDLQEAPKIPPVNLIQAQAQARLLGLQPSFGLFPMHPPIHQPLAQPVHQPLVSQALMPPAPAPAAAFGKPKRPHQDPDKVGRTIYVENVADDINEQVLADHFGVCGLVTAVRVSGMGPGLRKAWVEFDDASQARSAREYDQTGLGSAIIRVRPSKTAIHTNALADIPQLPDPVGLLRPRGMIPLRRDVDALGVRRPGADHMGAPDHRDGKRMRT